MQQSSAASHAYAEARTLKALVEGVASVLSVSPSLPEIEAVPLGDIHTLGPRLTSSHLASMGLLARAGIDARIVLHPSFEAILEVAARPGTADLAVVPSAFAGANQFFMSRRMRLIGCFCHDTPAYHLAWPAERADPFATAGEVRIASHPAPIDLLPRLVEPEIAYRVATYDSTVLAARAALQGKADAALCNLETIRAHGMAYRPQGIPISMSWNLFRIV